MIARLVPALALMTAPALAVPPATVAVAFDSQTIRPVLAEGLADRAANRAVTADDPVRIASVSKLVTALGVMQMVDRGQLDLDRDVSDYLGWALRNPTFPNRPITLRLLLSHQSSLIDGGERYVIPLGVTLRERLAEPEMWERDHAPGSGWFHYSNINLPVVASVMERVAGERFDALMARLVIRPLKLDACFNWGAGCSAKALSRAVVLYRATGEIARDDLGGREPNCLVAAAADGSCALSGYTPGWNGALFSPHGGLRISMRDLARIGQMLAREGRGFLSAGAYAELTHARWTFDGSNGQGEYGEADGFFCRYALAVQRIGTRDKHCRDDLFGDGSARLGHAGEAYGLRAGLWWDPVSGKGLAFFTSGVPDDAPMGLSGFTAAEESVVERATR